mgnify:FL=1
MAEMQKSIMELNFPAEDFQIGRENCFAEAVGTEPYE